MVFTSSPCEFLTRSAAPQWVHFTNFISMQLIITLNQCTDIGIVGIVGKVGIDIGGQRSFVEAFAER